MSLAGNRLKIARRSMIVQTRHQNYDSDFLIKGIIATTIRGWAQVGPQTRAMMCLLCIGWITRL